MGKNSDADKIQTSSIICSGSSITWGTGALDSSFVNNVEEYVRNKMSDTILCSDMNYSVNPTTITNSLLYKSTGRMISGVDSYCEFAMLSDEINICQMKRRTTDYGIMEVYADNILIGTFDNRNTIKHETEVFNGTDIKSVRLKNPCTFNHSITIVNNGSQVIINPEDISINTAGYGGTFPANKLAFVARTLDPNGFPVHIIQFASSYEHISQVTVSYDYGRIIAHERSTVGQTNNEYTNESWYGKGSVYYDPVNPIGEISSGMEFRAIDRNAYFTYKFTSAKFRTFKVKIVGGENPYFVMNYASSRFHNLMNAGIGGWSLGALLNDDKNCDYQQFFKYFTPDVIFQESSTNDDWSYPTRRISRHLGELTFEQISQIPYLELNKIVYNSGNDKYDTWSSNGIIQ